MDGAGKGGERLSGAAKICELRRMSGLTWPQLGDLFGVSRRVIHLWASGRPLPDEHTGKLDRLVNLFAGVARSNNTGRRGIPDNICGLLAQDRYEEARIALDALANIRPLRPPLSRLSDAAREARRPPGPANLVGAIGDRVDAEDGPRRAARVRRREKPSP